MKPFMQPSETRSAATYININLLYCYKQKYKTQAFIAWVAFGQIQKKKSSLLWDNYTPP